MTIRNERTKIVDVESKQTSVYKQAASPDRKAGRQWGYIMDDIYTTRYQAGKERKTSPRHDSDERIVKVDGGYTLMSEGDYQTWRKQQ